MISRSKDNKDRSNSRKKNVKNYELTDIYEKAYMNRTISPYQNNARRKLKSQRIGVDKGFGDNFIKVEKVDAVSAVYKKPYFNKRLAYQ